MASERRAGNRWLAIALATEFARRYEPRFHTALFVPDEWVLQMLMELMGELELADVLRRSVAGTDSSTAVDPSCRSDHNEGKRDEKSPSERREPDVLAECQRVARTS